MTVALRRGDLELLKGQGRFFAARARGLAMALLRAPLPHALIDRLDAGPARALPGVRLVLTAADLPRNGPLPSIDLTADGEIARHPLLARDRLLYVGQPLAVVVADTPAAARAGVAAIDLALTPLPPLSSIDAALAAPPLHGPAVPVQTLVHRAGDPEAAFAAAAHVIEENFTFHRVGAMPLEPRGAAADLDEQTGRLRLAATSQVPGALRAAVARELDLAETDIDVEPLRLGGGFGLKEAVYPEEILAAVAARKLGTAVRWQESRTEHLVAAVQGREGRVRLRMALDADGIVTALDVDGLSDIGAFCHFAGNFPGAAMGGMVRGPYRIPHFAARTRSIPTTRTPLNVYRGAGHPQAVFAMERMMDLAARRLGIDRFDLRRRNLIPPDAFPLDRGVAYDGAGPIIYDSGNYERLLDEALDAIGAAGFHARRAAHQRRHPAERLGLGLAMLVELTATGPDESVELTLLGDGRIAIATAAVEIGQRAAAALAGVAAPLLGVAPDRVDIAHARPLGGGGTFASRGAAVIGSAVADGALRLRAAILARAAHLLGVRPDDLTLADAAVIGPLAAPLTAPHGRNEPLSFAELAAQGDIPLTATGHHRVTRSSFASACHAAVVAIDIETGTVRVLDYAVAHDCGRVLDPVNVEDQIAGGVMQGLGATLFEELPLDATGRPLAAGLLDYVIPVAANLPAFVFRHVETPTPLNPLGAKGAGEGGFSGAPAALTSAIDDALSEFGPRLTGDGPYSPSRVLGLVTAPHSR